MTESLELKAVGRVRLWCDESARADLESGLRPAETLPVLTGRLGRGPIHRMTAAGVPALVRTYRRGGLAGLVLPDAFLLQHRAVREVLALRRLAPLGLAPRPLGLEVRGVLLKRMRLVVEEVASTTTLLEACARGWAGASLARLVGDAVRRMHEAGVAHPDLNVGNVLVAGDGLRAWLVDFDGAALFDEPVPPGRRARDVLRFCRSLDKWQESALSGARERGAFLRAALPAGQRRSVLRQARARHELRRMLGRRPRPAP